MEALLAVLDFRDYIIITLIVLVCAGGATYTTRQDMDIVRLKVQVRQLQKSLDALLKHQGIELPASSSGLSPEVEALARDPSGKIAAIKLYRMENPGVSLAEAKRRIEAFSQGG